MVFMLSRGAPGNPTVSLAVAGLGLAGSLDAGRSVWRVTRKSNCPLRVHFPRLVQQSPAAPLLEKVRAGAVTVATAWSHPGRVRSEAAFPTLEGVNPLPASSG